VEIDDLLQKQARELAELTDEQARRVLSALESSRNEIRGRLFAMEFENLDGEFEFTAQRLRGTLATLESGTMDLRARLGEIISEGQVNAHRLALDHLLEIVRLNEPGFIGALTGLEVNAIARLADRQALKLFRHSVDRYGIALIESIQREIMIGVSGQATIRQVADRISGAGGSVIAKNRGRAELIARMELNSAYNDGHLESAKEYEEMLEPEEREADPVLKRADEHFDMRTTPISLVLHGRAVRVADEWRVARSEVDAMAKAVGRSSGGIVWRLTDGVYHGARYPVHFNERGRQVTWRKSWSASPLLDGSLTPLGAL